VSPEDERRRLHEWRYDDVRLNRGDKTVARRSEVRRILGGTKRRAVLKA
jgi:hypothetical protein